MIGMTPPRLSSLAARDGEPSVLAIGDRALGGEHFALIAGPCTVETRDQTLAIAQVVKDAGATMLRGGAYKPRTSPYAFQGLGEAGLAMLAEAKALTGLPVVTELMDARDLEAVLEVADMIQIGARNMQNYALLTEVGRTRCAGHDQARPVEHDRGAADGRGVRAQGGQRARRPVRARDPHVRDRVPLHARPRRRPGAEVAQPPAGRRRPVARGRPARPRRAAVARRGRRRRRRDHRRGPPGSRRGRLRRSAVAALRRLRALRRARHAVAEVAGERPALAAV